MTVARIHGINLYRLYHYFTHLQQTHDPKSPDYALTALPLNSRQHPSPKIDADDSDVEYAKNALEMAGAEKIFLTSALTGEGLKKLSNYITDS